uniref:Arylsulfatase B-like n=1 Tax=Saccoglossus kowalevskii TaxID=10224 RepID=A0ABM0MGX3_SACKO|nr:PREDICTED: arylsulfatase B-like [Saccoglossus kowalevskii]
MAQSDDQKKSDIRWRKTNLIRAFLVIVSILAVVMALVIIELKFTHPEPSQQGPKTNKTVCKSRPPHIVLVIADDLGWNDVEWNNVDIKMPVLNQLAADGVIFNNTYVQPLCTPSRSALMTGYYPFKTGNQHQFLFNLHPAGLPLEYKILPERLKDVGYLTHAIGKWHLGFCKEDYLPTKRGFDSHYGPWTGSFSSHYTKMTQEGYDFRDNMGVVQQSNTYLTYMLTERAVDLIMGHYVEYPLYLQYNIDLPAKFPEVPPEYEALYSNITDNRTRAFYGKMSLIDDSVNSVVEALKTRGLWDDTLFIFISDNGAAASQAGSNWLWHIVDLHKTILTLAGAESESDIDGMDMWETFSKGAPSPRNEFVYNIDDFELSPNAAIRVGDYKLITGNPDLLYPFRLANRSDDWYNYGDVPINALFLSPDEDLPPPPNVTWLFNIKDDPEEKNDIAELYPEIVQELSHRLDEYREDLVPPVNLLSDPAGDAANFGGVWSSGWC